MKKTLDVDVYGKCGKLKCSRDDETGCYQNVEHNYKFYLSFEVLFHDDVVIVKILYSNIVVFFSLQNSVCEDYVTEKFFNILDYNIIPVTYSGANFSVGKYFAENKSHHGPLSRPWPRPALTCLLFLSLSSLSLSFLSYLV